MKLAQGLNLKASPVLDGETIKDIRDMGHSRIFVYDGDIQNVRGVLLVKSLLGLSPEEKKELASLTLRQPIVVKPTLNLLTVLNEFQKGIAHIALLSENPTSVQKAWEEGRPIPPDAAPVGFLTLEDVIERLLKEDIKDEDDIEREQSREKAVNILEKTGKLTVVKSWAARAKEEVSRQHGGLNRQISRLRSGAVRKDASRREMNVPLLGDQGQTGVP